jgi:hypothetical protein
LSSFSSHAPLLESVGQRFTLGPPNGAAVEALLMRVSADIPMNDSDVCHPATFELPVGINFISAPQGIFAPRG